MDGWSRRLLWLLLALAVIGADQWSKALVRDNLESDERIEIVDGLFVLNHVENPGAAFGLFSNMPNGYREVILIFFSVVVVVLAGIYSLRLPPGIWLSQLGLHLILAGAVGNNLIDRAMKGTVTDFLLFKWGEFIFPSFNIADMAIVLGITLLLVEALRPRRAPAETEISDTEQSTVLENGTGGSGENSIQKVYGDVR